MPYIRYNNNRKDNTPKRGGKNDKRRKNVDYANCKKRGGNGFAVIR